MSLFQDDDWFRKLLDDEELLEQIGLPTDMTDEEKDELIEQIESNQALKEAIELIEDEMLQPDKYLATEIPFSTKITPAKQFIQEACLDLGMVINNDDDLDMLQVGKSYTIIFPNKKIIEVQIENIVESQMGYDFIFYNISGAEDLIKLVKATGEYDDGVFPVPHQFLYSTIIRPLD